MLTINSFNQFKGATSNCPFLWTYFGKNALIGYICGLNFKFKMLFLEYTFFMKNFYNKMNEPQKRQILTKMLGKSHSNA